MHRPTFAPATPRPSGADVHDADLSMRVLEAGIASLALIAAILLGFAH